MEWILRSALNRGDGLHCGRRCVPKAFGLTVIEALLETIIARPIKRGRQHHQMHLVVGDRSSGVSIRAWHDSTGSSRSRIGESAPSRQRSSANGWSRVQPHSGVADKTQCPITNTTSWRGHGCRTFLARSQPHPECHIGRLAPDFAATTQNGNLNAAGDVVVGGADHALQGAGVGVPLTLLTRAFARGMFLREEWGGSP